MADYAADIEFKCPDCEELVEATVQVSPPNWTEDKAIDRIVQEEITLDCPNCAAEFDAEVTNCDNQVEISLTEYPETEVRCGMGHDRAPDDDDWDLPASPAAEFRFSVNDALELLRDQGSEYGPSTVNRMVFISCFAAFEAYLGDTLLKYVLGDDVALKRVLQEEADLKTVKIDLLTILTDDDVVFNAVTNHLKGVLWHNFAKVDAIYKVATTFSIFDDVGVRTLLFKALPLRHDCVHRNGRDKDGNPRIELTRSYVNQIANGMLTTVTHIEQSIATQTV